MNGARPASASASLSQRGMDFASWYGAALLVTVFAAIAGVAAAHGGARNPLPILALLLLALAVALEGPDLLKNRPVGSRTASLVLLAAASALGVLGRPWAVRASALLLAVATYFLAATLRDEAARIDLGDVCGRVEQACREHRARFTERLEAENAERETPRENFWLDVDCAEQRRLCEAGSTPAAAAAKHRACGSDAAFDDMVWFSLCHGGVRATCATARAGCGLKWWESTSDCDDDKESCIVSGWNTCANMKDCGEALYDDFLGTSGLVGASGIMKRMAQMAVCELDGEPAFVNETNALAMLRNGRVHTMADACAVFKSIADMKNP